MVSRCAVVVAVSLVVAALAQSVSADVPLVDGTRVRVRLAQVISSETSTPGDVIACTVIQDVVVDGVVVIAHGTPVTGRIVTWPLCRSCISTYRAHRWEHLSRRITVIAV